MGQIKQALVHLEALVVEPAREFVELRIRVINTKKLFAHLFKKHESCINAVQHVHVDFPHAPADIDRLLKILEKFDIGSRIKIQFL